MTLPRVQFYLEEKKGNIDYLGWVGRQDGDYTDDVNLVSVKFAWGRRRRARGREAAQYASLRLNNRV